MSKKQEVVSAKEAANMIKESNGKFMTVVFTKRSTGENRKMNCRTGVKKGVKGSGKRRAQKDGLITVYDMSKKGFRTINISGLRSICMNNKNYCVE
ncbi:MAG: hypothetical protein ACOC56_04620 [Atribacterota bacterium]